MGPISDYGLIGNCRTAALVSRGGSIDWMCWPRFDSPALFCRLLDERRGGFFSVAPLGPHHATRGYVGATNVLRTAFAADGGQAAVIDFMPLGAPGDSLVRVVEGLAGEVELAVRFRATFGYAGAATEHTPCPGGAVARAGGEVAALTCPLRFEADDAGALSARLRVRAGERVGLLLTFGAAAEEGPLAAAGREIDVALIETLAFWRRWSALGSYDGPYRALVGRSALALKLLTYRPSGAFVAAPTTSLPGAPGGARNWDQRYTWIRDAALTLYALESLGYKDESRGFWRWLEGRCLGAGEAPKVVHAVDGGPVPAEEELAHLQGYRGSVPVRVGNAAARQPHPETYGYVLDAAELCQHRIRAPEPALAPRLAAMADHAAEGWHRRGQGIWEVRSEPKHFVSSKLLSWAALDRAIRLEGAGVLEGDVTAWARERARIREAILDRGWDAEQAAFTQRFGEPELDASVLLMPVLGFLPARDPRVQSTVDQVRRQLGEGGLLRRYRASDGADGLPGEDAPFASCSLWLAEVLALAGRTEAAAQQLERVAGYANDLGLLAEQIDPVGRELLGNFPQAFSHLSLVRAALTIDQAERRGAEGRAHTPAERADEAERR